jgi:hypothetical protein
MAPDSQSELFNAQAEERDDRLPPDQSRNCGRCGNEFWSKVQRSRPTFTPLFCGPCDAALGAALQRRTARWRLAVERARGADLMDVADALIRAAGVKTGRKRAPKKTINKSLQRDAKGP